MMKMKRSLSILLAIVMVFALLPTVVFAATATFTFSGASQVSYGKEINVTVILSATEKMSSWSFAVRYDPAVLEYVEGGSTEIDGVITFTGKEESASTAKTSFSDTIKFRTKKVGEVTLSIQDAKVEGFTDESPAMTVKQPPTKKIEIIAARNGSEINTLESITVSKGELKPKFEVGKTEYSVTVPYETSSIQVEAKATDEKAKVFVTEIAELAVGANKFEVVVVAENGTAAVYTVTVTREDSELAGVTVEIDGKTYNVAYDPTKLSVPAGYKPKTVAYGDKQILVFAAPQEVLQIAYLTSEGMGAWFVYNSYDKSFTEFLSQTGNATSLVILTPSEDVKIPDGYVAHKLTVGDKTWPVFKGENSEKDGIWLVYAMNSEGDGGFYFYDAKLGTFSSYYEPLKDKKAEEEAAKELANVKNQLKESEAKAGQLETLFLGVAGLAALLLVCLIISAVTKKKKIVYLDSAEDSKKKKKKNDDDLEGLPENEFVLEKAMTEAAPAPVAEPKSAPAVEKIETAVPVAPEAPKRRRAVRSMDGIGSKEAAPAPTAEPQPEIIPEIKPEPRTAPVAEPVPEIKPEPAPEKKADDSFKFDDMPPILR